MRRAAGEHAELLGERAEPRRERGLETSIACCQPEHEARVIQVRRVLAGPVQVLSQRSPDRATRVLSTRGRSSAPARFTSARIRRSTRIGRTRLSRQATARPRGAHGPRCRGGSAARRPGLRSHRLRPTGCHPTHLPGSRVPRRAPRRRRQARRACRRRPPIDPDPGRGRHRLRRAHRPRPRQNRRSAQGRRRCPHRRSRPCVLVGVLPVVPSPASSPVSSPSASPLRPARPPRPSARRPLPRRVGPRSGGRCGGGVLVRIGPRGRASDSPLGPTPGVCRADPTRIRHPSRAESRKW